MASERQYRLPVLLGAEHLGFRCNGCGDCCRTLRVTVTHHDLRRLSAALKQPAAALVEWLAPDAVDMTEEPGSFAELAGGRRLMVLAQAEGACRLLSAEQRCSAYAVRPWDCRLYPLALERDEQGRISRVSRLDRDGCGDEQAAPAPLDQLGADDEQRWAELSDYQAHLARWNQLARHRRRFRHPLGEANELLAFLGLESK
ncbi:MAG TPA: YkgJ family cysteine cluster protein [Polyangiaceae bacterium]|nr:YkgJ family cysteine cluster protein [Polyangiaceae bacterium]